ncbi:MAG: aminotransferase class V-fold PLP-dependent enzyme [Methanoregula sp.]|nr:aminotransferase class V-fold PLP-dependent enzyme [Methanoregula sp.]
MGAPVIYLNNAATSWPKPPEVIAAVTEALEQPFSEAGRSTPGLSADCISEARAAVARYFHAPEPDHLVFCASATDALNMLIQGFAKTQKDPFHVLMTELDHNSVIRPLRALEADGRCRITVVPCTGAQIDPSDVAGAIRPDTRLMVMAHGSNVLGSVQDISAVGKILRERGIFFIVDGAQTAGLVPIYLGSLPVDAFVFTGHKYLFGLPGTGGFYIRDPAKVAATRQGGTGTNSRSPFQPVSMPDKFEAGTHNYPGIISLAAGVRVLERTGIDVVMKSSRDRNAVFLHQFPGNNALEVYNSEPELPIVSLNVKAIGNDDAGFVLRTMYGIVTRTGLHCSPLVHDRIDGGGGCIRLSPSLLTSIKDCQRAADVICEVADRAHHR